MKVRSRLYGFFVIEELSKSSCCYQTLVHKDLTKNCEYGEIESKQIDIRLGPLENQDNSPQSLDSDDDESEESDVLNTIKRKRISNDEAKSSQIELTFALGNFDNSEIVRLEEEKEKKKLKIDDSDAQNEIEAAVIRAFQPHDEGQTPTIRSELGISKKIKQKSRPLIEEIS